MAILASFGHPFSLHLYASISKSMEPSPTAPFSSDVYHLIAPSTTTVNPPSESELANLMHIAAQNSQLVNFESATFLGHSILNLDIHTIKSIAESKGYQVSLDASTPEYANDDGAYWFLIASKDLMDIGPDISALQYFNSSLADVWGIQRGIW